MMVQFLFDSDTKMKLWGTALGITDLTVELDGPVSAFWVPARLAIPGHVLDSVVRRPHLAADVPGEPFDFARHVTVFSTLRPAEWLSGTDDGRNGERGTNRTQWATFRPNPRGRNCHGVPP